MKWIRATLLLAAAMTAVGLVWSFHPRLRYRYVLYGEDPSWIVDRYRRAARRIQEKVGADARIVTDRFDMHYAWMQYDLYPIRFFHPPGGGRPIEREWCRKREITHVLLSDPRHPDDPDRLRLLPVEDYFR